MQPPAPLLFLPVKAAATPPAGQSRPFLGEDAEAKIMDSIQRVPVNPFRRASKGTESGKHYDTFQTDLFVMHLTASFVPKNSKTEIYLIKDLIIHLHS